MMAAKITCKNCGANHSCGCAIKKAKDGKSCCTACVKDYNLKIK